MERTGGCLCGSVRYVARGEPLNQRVCHCRLCQRAIGAAFNARLLYRAEAVVLTGPLATHSSSPDLARGFCRACGATVAARRASTGTVGLTASSLDDPSLFQPTMHIWTSSRQPWLLIDDGLAQYPEGAPG